VWILDGGSFLAFRVVNKHVVVNKEQIAQV